MYNLWNNGPDTQIEYFAPNTPDTGKAVVVFPGGAYRCHAEHEGGAYARFLAALVSTYSAPLDGEITDEIDEVDSRPNAQILCYPVICGPESDVVQPDSYLNLVGDLDPVHGAAVDPIHLADGNTPPAFIWHTHTDEVVNVINAYRYGEALRRAGVLAEMHVFPEGPHGMGISLHEPHVGQWTDLLFNWLAKYL